MKQQQVATELSHILIRDQQADGSFLSYSVPAGTEFGAEATTYTTTFAAALIGGALAGVHDPQVAPVRERVAEFLLEQRGRMWSFNYWARREPEVQVRSYPDDWDDTSCAVIALTHLRPRAVTGEVLGHMVTLLNNTEVREGGPYRTWIVGPNAHEHWHDVDIAVNANIAGMLQLHGVDLPNLDQLADAAIVEDRLASPYYPSPYPIEYFLSRWYRGQHQKRLLEGILARRRQEDGGWGNVLNTALAVSALLNLGVDPAAVAGAVQRLRTLRADEVKADGFCFDPSLAGQPYVAGSRALTAAYCLEAIAKYDAVAQRDSSPLERSQPWGGDQHLGRMHAHIVEQAGARFERAGAPIRAASKRLFDRLLGGTAGGQITTLPYLFRKAVGERGREISDERVITLGLISLYGWVAYTVYDDFLDDEGTPFLLPLANVALRELTLILQQEATAIPGFGTMAWSILDQQETANAWEARCCRVRLARDLIRVAPPQFGDLSSLAERSMGHALGCLAITIELGYEPDSPQVQAIQRFFRHFLIARQLSDDARDWKEDLQKGQINAVGAHLLNGIDRRQTTVRALYTKLERFFWEQAVNEVNEWIFRETSAARTALREAGFVQKPAVLEALLEPIEEAARKTHAQQQKTSEFLRAYQPESSPDVG